MGTSAEVTNRNRQGNEAHSERLSRASRLGQKFEVYISEIEKAVASGKLLSKRDLDEDFGAESCGPAPIDVVLIGKLRSAMMTIDTDLIMALEQRNLLPMSLSAGISVARFLSITLPSARGVQTFTGVPASILIADSYCAVGPGTQDDYLASNDPFRLRHGLRFESLYDAFEYRAGWLKNNPDFQAVLLAAGDPVKYVRELSRCIIWDDLERLDRIDLICKFDLMECDSLRSGKPAL